MGSYTFEKYLLAETGPAFREKLLAFAAQASEGINPGYLESRFGAYPEVLVAYQHGQLCAMQLMQMFVSGEDRYYYLGPLFSSGGAFFSMFTDWLTQVFTVEEKGAVYLAAEFQNSDLFLFFKTIFYEHSFPLIHTDAVPGYVQQVALLFSEQVNHMISLDLGNLSSKCDEVARKRKTRHAEIISWMESRGVRMMKEHHQLLIVCIPLAERDPVLAGLRMYAKDRYALKNKEQEVLRQFRKTIRKNDSTLFCTGQGR